MSDIILVDKDDNQIGVGEKLEVHKKGLLHRAFSIVIFDRKGKMLLQKRAQGKYHCGGLWTNACCSHPTPGSDIKKEAQKRLTEEMGFTPHHLSKKSGAGFTCPLEEVFTFHYKVDLGRLTENEIDHVFKGIYNGKTNPNPAEAEDAKWAEPKELKKDISKSPEKYTYWFKKICGKLFNHGSC